MKKVLGVVLASVLVFSLSGCQGKTTKKDSKTASNSTSTSTNNSTNNNTSNNTSDSTTTGTSNTTNNSTSNSESTSKNTNQSTNTNKDTNISGNLSTKDVGNIVVNSVTYKDGTYDIKNKSEKTGYEEAIVTIKGGKITAIQLKKLDGNSKEVNYDEWNGTKNGQPNLKQFKEDLAKTMVSKQSSSVDAIAGATVSTNGWKQAVADALVKASQ